MNNKSDNANPRPIEISHQPVELYKILKFEGLIPSGGEAKAIVASGRVRVNGEPETQKRKKIVSGDIIEFEGNIFEIKLAPQAQSNPAHLAPESKPPSIKKSAPRSAIALTDNHNKQKKR